MNEAMKNELSTSFFNTEGEATEDIFPVITLYQPWATWIMREWKTIETRTHAKFACLINRTILIHAGMTTDDSDYAVKNPYLTREQILHDPDEMVNGFILGFAHVYDFMALSDFDSKKALIDCGITLRYGLFLEGINKFEKPIPCKGEMGIWYYDYQKREKVKKPSAAGVLKKDVHQTNLWNTI